MKENTRSRLLLFFIALPVFVLAIWFDPSPQMIFLNSLVLLFGTGASIESARLFGLNIHRPRTLAGTILVGSIPLINGLIVVFFSLNTLVFYAGLMVTLTMVLTYVLAAYTVDKGESFYAKAGAAVVLTVYPGAFLGHFILMTMLEHSKLIILLFFMTIFMNDSLAYVGGKLFGKYSFRPFPLSPKKTTVGLMFGLVTSVSVMGIGYVLFPQLFPLGIFSAMTVGLITGILGVFGDLLESGFKRSAGLKDSGNIIPGRGGIMDSFDSALFAVPMYYFAFLLFQS
jgi:phosphatidate cytidylyltransferase